MFGVPVPTRPPSRANVCCGLPGHNAKSPLIAAIAPCARAMVLVLAKCPKVFAESAVSTMTARFGSTRRTRIWYGPLES